MKRVLSVVLAAVIAVAGVSFTGCKKKEDTKSGTTGTTGSSSTETPKTGS
jgi:hypothetical protein